MRQHKRHNFEVFILEHRPEGADHPQDSRTLVCKNFSEGGLKIEGQPRYQRCEYTLALPPEFKKVRVEGRVIRRDREGFAVAFTSPSPELTQILADWT